MYYYVLFMFFLPYLIILLQSDLITFTARPDSPSACRAGNVTDTTFMVICTEGFDGGSDVTFDLQFVADGVYHSVMKSEFSYSNITSQQSGTLYVMRMCASNEEFPEELSCSIEFNVTTTGKYYIYMQLLLYVTVS